VELESGLIPYAKLAYGHFFESRKDDLTRWWLQLIEKSTDSFLRSLGYDFDAVPFHYIDQPPRSMPVILKNLQMIRFLLKASGKNLDRFGVSLRPCMTRTCGWSVGSVYLVLTCADVARAQPSAAHCR
jgi:hypothetical protein